MFRRIIDRLLSVGEGKQLAWLVGIVLVLYGIFCLVGRIWGLDWTDILTLYLDPGNFPIDHQANDIFSLIVTLSGILILSALMISVFSNVFSNIAEAYRKGERRYRFSGHVLILGGGHPLADMLKALQKHPDFVDKDIVVMTSSDVEALRAEMEEAIDDAAFCRRITWYRGERDNREDLLSACAPQACCIYLIGEDGEAAHDSRNVGAMDLLRAFCAGEGQPLPCYIALEMRTSQDVFQYLPKADDSRLRIEIVNTSDYLAEQLLVDTPFLPVPDPGQRLHIVIAGGGRTARSFAAVAAQICHFPDFAKSGCRTLISFINNDIREEMDHFVANRESLFELSHYAYVSPAGREEHVPKEGYGDFLDLEWEFIDSRLSSPFVREQLEAWAADPAQKLVVAICHESASMAFSSALHLPKAIYKANVPVAVYQKDHAELMNKAVATGMFGQLRCFGEATPGTDALLLRRSERGQRVNYLYDLEYGNPPAASAAEAWAGLSFAHQLSSIASANSIPMKLRAFGLEPTRASVDALDAEALEALSEVEHRRWMTTVLLTGYRAAPKCERSDRGRFKELKNKEFIHLDIAPYDELAHEADKDRLIVQNIPYIMNGEEIVRI